MTCDACARALEHPRTGRFNAGCKGCSTRAIAQSPEFAEAALAGTITPRYRAALQRLFPGREDEAHAEAKVWSERLEVAS